MTITNGSVNLEKLALDTVQCWWTAWVNKDREAIDRLAHPAYDETDEQGHFRTLCHEAVIAEVEAGARDGSVVSWSLSQLGVHRIGRLIVCNYAFVLRIRRGKKLVGLKGRASDILIQEELDLLYLSHSGCVTESGGIAGAAMSSASSPE